MDKDTFHIVCAVVGRCGVSPLVFDELLVLGFLLGVTEMLADNVKTITAIRSISFY